MKLFTLEFILDALERAGRTFLQFYLGAWVLASGFLNTNFDVPNQSSFDLLFTMSNLKAGVVGVALAIATAVGVNPLKSK